MQNAHAPDRRLIGSLLALAVLGFAFVYRWFSPQWVPSPEQDQGNSVDLSVPSIAITPEPAPQSASKPVRDVVTAPARSKPSARRKNLTAEQRKQLEDALARAEAAMRIEQWLQPVQDSADYWYAQALLIDPQDPSALAGRQRLQSTVVEQIHTFIDKGDLHEADALLTLMPVWPELRAETDRVRLRRQNQPQVEILLRQGAQRMAAGQRFEPEPQSALASYRAALQLDPRSTVARQGLAEVASSALSRALMSANENDFAQAERLLQVSDSIAPGIPAAIEVRNRVATLKQQRAENLLSAVQSALDAHQLTSAQDLLDTVAGIAPQDPRLTDLRQRVANAELYHFSNPGDVITDSFIDRQGSAPPLVVIPVGRFRMGSTKAERGHRPEESPAHEVIMDRPFALGRNEVTVADFRQFASATEYASDAEKLGSSVYYDEKNGRLTEGRNINWRHDFMGGPARDPEPVVHVSARDAQAYVQWLSERTGKPYRLPSEAEFEYALRAGTQTRYAWGNGNPTTLVGNLSGDGDRSRNKRKWNLAFPRYRDQHWGPAPVAGFAANLFGLYDMHGNVAEWVQDCWHDTYLRAPERGEAWVNEGCAQRVVRGGSWASAPEQFRSAFRMPVAADARSARFGFRVARNL